MSVWDGHIRVVRRSVASGGGRHRHGLTVRLWVVGLLALVCWGRGAVAQEYAFRHYGAETGVTRAYAVAFDGDGQLLVGTNDGIVRFDGRAFESVPLPVEGAVWRLEAGPDGTVWGLTDRADLVRVALDGTAERIPPPAPVRDRLLESIWRHRIRVDGRGRLWLSVGDGVLYHWDGPSRPAWSALRIPGTDSVGDFFFRGDGDDGTLVVAADRGVGEIPIRAGRLQPGHWTPTSARLWWVRPHPSARAWAGGAEGVYLLGEDGILRTVSPPGRAPWPHNEPGVDRAGRLLTLLEGSETSVVRFNSDGTLDLTTENDRSLSGLLANQLAFDSEGALWIAHSNGLTTLQDEWAVAFPLEVGGRRATVFGMAGDAAQGSLWVSTYGGMFRFEDGHLVRADSDIGWGAYPPVLVGRGGAEWVEVRGNHAVSEFRSRNSQGDVRARPLVVHVGRGGRYETDEAGLWRVRNGRRKRLGSMFIPGALGAEDARGRLWIGGDPGRIDVVWGDTLGSACPACLPPSLRDALDALNQRPTWFTVTTDRHGRVWVGGLPGLAVLWERGDGTWSHRLFGTEDGLLSRNVAVSLSPDGHRLWVGTLRGIQGLRVRAGTPTLDPFIEIGARDGLPGESAGALVEDSNGYLWGYLRVGLVHRLDWRALSAPPPSPTVRIARAQVNGRPVGLGSSFRLHAGDDLALGLWPRTYRRPERVRIEYRLSKGDGPWTSLGTGRQIALASVPAGQHALDVRAVRPGRAPGPAVRLHLYVAAPFWHTWPFALLVGLGVGAALFGVHRVREGRRQATDALRQRIASDLHDEMGGGLTQVSLYSELIRRAVETGGDGAPREDPDRVAAWAEHVGAQARSLSESMRDVVWAIRPDEGAWQDLELRLKDAAVALLAPRGIEPDLGGEVPDRPPPLSPEVRQNVLLFVKEALHNAVRHAEPTRVEVRWRLTRRTLSLRVCDDGRGFDPATVRRGVGLASLRRRAHDLGGTLHIDTAPGRGACLALDVPLRSRRARREPTRSGR